MKTYEIASWGCVETVTIGRSSYRDNDSLAVVLTCENGEPYGVLTTNIPDSDVFANAECAFVDTNNFPTALEFIEKNGLGTNTGIIGFSGFCQYPLVRFDLSKLPVL